jgi:hypothetical protein
MVAIPFKKDLPHVFPLSLAVCHFYLHVGSLTMQNQYPHHIAQHPSHAASHESSSVSSTASPQAPLPPLANLSGSGPPSRPSSGLNISLPSQHNLPPGPAYPRAYESNSASPADHAALYSDASLPNGMMGGNTNLSQAHMAAAGLQSQKRAYRQRRKDPSCDACRERKVKVCSGRPLQVESIGVELTIDSSATQPTHQAAQSAQAGM